MTILSHLFDMTSFALWWSCEGSDLLQLFLPQSVHRGGADMNEGKLSLHQGEQGVSRGNCVRVCVRGGGGGGDWSHGYK